MEELAATTPACCWLRDHPVVHYSCVYHACIHHHVSLNQVQEIKSHGDSPLQENATIAVYFDLTEGMVDCIPNSIYVCKHTHTLCTCIVKQWGGVSVHWCHSLKRFYLSAHPPHIVSCHFVVTGHFLFWEKLVRIASIIDHDPILSESVYALKHHLEKLSHRLLLCTLPCPCTGLSPVHCPPVIQHRHHCSTVSGHMRAT